MPGKKRSRRHPAGRQHVTVLLLVDRRRARRRKPGHLLPCRFLVRHRAGAGQKRRHTCAHRGILFRVRHAFPALDGDPERAATIRSYQRRRAQYIVVTNGVDHHTAVMQLRFADNRYRLWSERNSRKSIAFYLCQEIAAGRVVVFCQDRLPAPERNAALWHQHLSIRDGGLNHLPCQQLDHRYLHRRRRD